VVKEDHNRHGIDERQNVGDDGDVEVELALAVGTEERHSQNLDDEKSRDDDVAETEEGAFLPLTIEDVLGEQKLDRALDVGGNSDHDISAENPENVVEEETREQNGTSD